MYSHVSNRYDHHQASFKDTFSIRHKVTLSSAGLIYKHYGREILEIVLNEEIQKLPEQFQFKVSKQLIDKTWMDVYDNFILAIDGDDTGVNPSNQPLNYAIRTTLPHRVRRLNTPWYNDFNDESQMKQFVKAVELTGADFVEYLKKDVIGSYAGAHLFGEYVKSTEKEFGKNGIVVFERAFPWKQALFDYEEEHKEFERFKYVMYPQDPSNPEGITRVQAVPKNPLGGFDMRQPILPTCLGLRDDALSRKSGIEGCIFVHKSGFIGGNATRKGAMKMALESLN